MSEVRDILTFLDIIVGVLTVILLRVGLEVNLEVVGIVVLDTTLVVGTLQVLMGPFREVKIAEVIKINIEKKVIKVDIERMMIEINIERIDLEGNA